MGHGPGLGGGRGFASRPLGDLLFVAVVVAGVWCGSRARGWLVLFRYRSVLSQPGKQACVHE
jgi:hypothetical protein